VAIRWLFDGSVEASVTPLLEDIERRLTWRPQHGVTVVNRMVKIAAFTAWCCDAFASRIAPEIDAWLGSLW